MKLTEDNIVKVMKENDSYEFFGLRHDSHAYEIGDGVYNSHQMSDAVVVAEFE